MQLEKSALQKTITRLRETLNEKKKETTRLSQALRENTHLPNSELANHMFGISDGFMRGCLELNLHAPSTLKEWRPLENIEDHSHKSWLEKAVATLNNEDKVCQIHHSDEIFTNKQASVWRTVLLDAGVLFIRLLSLTTCHESLVRKELIYPKI
uniref:Uncharacterized protein n=1 Tax=Glossina austeni TaxID=7395 RepID=A0A1A9UIU8_GLOAU